MRNNTTREVVAAIESSWSQETSELPDRWLESNPAAGHCDVSSFVAWEHLGGDLVLSEVHLNGEFQEFHYWNRIDGEDLDLTRRQFQGGEVITELKTLESEFIVAGHQDVRPEFKARLDAFRRRVDKRLPSRRSPQDASGTVGADRPIGPTG